MHFAAVVFRMRSRHRIARHGHQRDVARVDEAAGNMARAVFEPMQWFTSVAGSISTPKRRFIEPRRGLFELGHTVVGITTIDRLIDLARHHGADRFGGHLVILANAEVDQLPLGMLGHGFAWPA